MISDIRQNYQVLLPGLLLGFLSLLVLTMLGNFETLGGTFSGFNWIYFLLALGMSFLHHLLRFLNLNFSLNVTGIRRISFGKRITFYLSGSALNATDQHVNESYKNIWISKACGIPYNRVDSVSLIDEISASLSIFVLVILGVIAYPNFWPLFLVLLVLVGLLVMFLQYNRTSGEPVEVSENPRFLIKLRLRFSATRADNEKMFKSIPLTISLALNVLAWLTQAAALFLILLGLGLPPDLSMASLSCLVLAFSIMIGFLSNMPGGLGVVELALAGLLSVLMGYQPELAVTATILFRLSTFWISLLFGILFWPKAARSCSNEPGAVSVAQS
jgi:uncharacterized protein (TIRG00374 family)